MSETLNTPTATREVIRRYVATEFLPGTDPADLPDGTDLLNGGVIDSLGLLKIIAWLETTFDVVVEDTDLDPENFRDLTAMAAFVDAARSGPRG
ncbi:acyl carrier protein [Paenibacillus sp. TRM 82003]|uniref:acyl carrier protein n=1 Tax=Kineococcus sp. TRM81007 TaxID=2925831 RepID=UPI001F585B5A|nr:acyl carrier protein [Kineococcus sp. TRM81007]MCI2237321.1 acyl carrier protein [Kineococcus sp. TRM81007]MCI3926572.1 acyl carrier protein [Paenibacillus sp. TRM 82003]